MTHPCECLFLQLNLEAIHAESRSLDDTVKQIMNGSISNDILEIRWPLGVAPSSQPDTRYDVQTWSLMNETHQIMANSEENIKLLSKIDQEDIKVSHSNDHFQTVRFTNNID